jgi:hypothetical protein
MVLTLDSLEGTMRLQVFFDCICGGQDPHCCRCRGTNEIMTTVSLEQFLSMIDIVKHTSENSTGDLLTLQPSVAPIDVQQNEYLYCKICNEYFHRDNGVHFPSSKDCVGEYSEEEFFCTPCYEKMIKEIEDLCEEEWREGTVDEGDTYE